MSAANLADVDRVRLLCGEVLKLAQEVRDNLLGVDAARKAGVDAWYAPDTVKSAALKRRSMDLTRALAQLRRPS